MSHSNNAQTSRRVNFPYLLSKGFRGRMFISVRFFCQQRSGEYHKRSHTRFLVGNCLYQVNIFLTTRNSSKGHPSAVDELPRLHLLNILHVSSSFGEDFVSRKLDYSITYTNNKNSVFLNYFIIPQEKLGKSTKNLTSNQNNTADQTQKPLRFPACYLLSAVFITLGREAISLFVIHRGFQTLEAMIALGQRQRSFLCLEIR